MSAVEGVEAAYVLSPLQQGLLFHSLEREKPGQYVDQFTIELEGELDVAALEGAFQRAVSCHPVLRTSFHWEGLDKPAQVVHAETTLPLRVEDWDQQADALGLRLESFLERDRLQGFDLTSPPLMRLAVIRLGRTRSVLVWTLHHLILDGWSCDLIRQQVFADYAAAVTGTHVQAEAGPPFRDYISWLSRQPAAHAERFWKQELNALPEPVALADLLAARRSTAGPSARERHWALSQRLSTDLKALARRHRVTLSAIFQAAWAILLAQYGRRDEVVFGLTVSGRSPSIPGIERMVGNLINTVPFRMPFDPGDDMAGVLRRVQAANARIQPHEHAPLADIQQWVRGSGARGPQALFDSILVFENAHATGAISSPGGPSSSELRVTSVRHLFQTNYPLVLQVSPTEPVSVRLVCDGTRIGQAGVARLTEQLTTILDGMVGSARARALEAPVLTAAARHLATLEWNDTTAEYPAGSLPELFAQQAAATPAAVALVDDAGSVTYAELNERANRVARMLAVRGVRAETPVALLARRSSETIAALLGILRAGGTCVPLDISYPPDRLTFMLWDSGAAIVLTGRGLIPHGLPGTAAVVSLDEIAGGDADGTSLPPHPFADQSAYLVYTSGSTGTPKAVAVPHRAIARLVCNTRYVHLDAAQISLAHSPPSFDASFFELWSTLLHGGRCVLFAGRGLTPADLRHQVGEHRVNLLWLTASLFHLVMDEAPTALEGVRQLVVGGETMSPRHAAAAARIPGLTLFNGYGPTEATTFSASFRLTSQISASQPVPLGRPITNGRVYVLDTRLNQSAIGAIGEIFVGGDGLARGYVRDPCLTADRFLPDPFASQPGARMYRTGDLARLLESGDVEFIGREDSQIKIRGFRVELGEVEAVLRTHPAVRECAVAAVLEGQGSRRLVAYVVLDPSGASSTEDIRRFVEQTLPDYMVPADFVVLQALPLTPHGKLNRRELPMPVRASRPETAEARRTGTPVEEILTGIWCAVLGVTAVDRADDFFQLGGHSLLAIRALSRIREAFGFELPLHALFEHPTLGELASEIAHLSGTTDPAAIPAIEPDGKSGDVPLSFAQQRLWIIEQLEPGIPAYNLLVAVSLTGGRPDLPDLLRRSLQTVLDRHDVLRTILPVVDGHPVQRVQPHLRIGMPVIDLSLLPEAARTVASLELTRAEALRSFDLASGPLVRALLMRHAAANHVLLLAVHHIVADGASLDVLFHELLEAYSSLSAGRTPGLAPLPVQYGDYARWQRGWMSGTVLDSLLAFWRGQLADPPPPMRLPTDRPRPSIQTFRGGREVMTFPGTLSQAIDDLALGERATPFMVLLAGFFALLHRYTGDEDLVVGTPAANRNRVQLEPMIGFFVNTLVLRTRVDKRRSFRDLVAAIRETTLEAYAHQDLPFEKLVEELQPPRHLGSSPYFQVVFAMHEETPVRSIDGLTIVPVETESVAAKFDLTMYVLRRDRDLTISVEFNRDLFDSTTIGRLLEHYKNVMSAVVHDPGAAVAALPLLSDAEAHLVMREWNDTEASYPAGATIHELFEAQARATPDATALKHRDTQVTYRELNRMANRVAHHLRERGVGPETTVGVFLTRSVTMVAALLGVLKAGGAYLPLDPEYPVQRLAYMLRAARASRILTEPALRDKLPVDAPELVLVSDAVLEAGPDTNPPLVASAENLAYVIYTSGSTGAPKGIMIAHRSAVVLLYWVRENFPADELPGMLAGTSICFDVSIFELFGPLSWGGTVRLIENALEMSDFVDDPTIRLVGSVPSAMIELVRTRGIPRSATTVNLAGEAVPAGLAATIFQGPNVRRITNLYGPTEDTTFSSMALLPREGMDTPSVGRPVANTRFFVLDREWQPVPAGAVGQVYIAGDGLARGYLGGPDLTAERFLPDPLSGQPGARMYRTGDQARYRMNGEVECLGRLDHQVKVRGFRVELGEIEAVLREQPGVKQVVAVAREQEPQLVAYLVPEADEQLRVEEIQTAARGRLPSYMLPTAYCVIERVPLLPNGKADRSALPHPVAPPSSEHAEVARPGNDVEQGIVDVLAEALHRSDVGAHDHFFSDLGGHSLLAVRVVAKIRERIGRPVSVIDLFQFPTAAALASHLSEQPTRDAPAPPSVQARRQRLEAIDRRRAFRIDAQAEAHVQES